jgi:putative transposase
VVGCGGEGHKHQFQARGVTPLGPSRVQLLAFDGEDDHVHLLVAYPPKVAVASLVNSLKGASSRLVRQAEFPEVRQRLWGGHFWSPSYCAVSCGGAPLKIIKQYVEQQRNPESQRTRRRPA